MSELYNLDQRDLRKLKKFFRKMPSKVGWATANILNDFGFGTRREQLNVIKESMTIRNEKFVNSSIRVIKTRGTIPPSSQKVIVGSLNRPRFSGWSEQIEGGTKTRMITQAARNNKPTTQVRPMYRLRKGKVFLKPSKFPGTNKTNRIISMLRILKRKKERKPFIVDENIKNLNAGLYAFKGKRLMRLQTFKTVAVKKIDWRKEGIEKYFKSIKIRDLWAKSLKRVLKF